MPASSTDPSTWSSYTDAVKALDYYDHLGFVFADNGIVGIDIDVGYDEDGLMTELAADIISTCQSYTEISKSRRGFHILIKGDLPFKGKNNLHGVEIYKSARFFIMTGDVLLFPDIVENQSAIDYVVSKYFPSNKEQKTGVRSDRIYHPVWTPPGKGKIRVRPDYPRIPSGSRNLCLTSLAGMMHTTGYSKHQIYEELKLCNQIACDPPLDIGEIKSICNSVTRYQR